MSGNGDDRLRSALRDSYRALADNGIAALVVGGVAISYHLDGEPKVDHDIDLFIAEADLEKAMEALESSGFAVTRTHPTWLFKGRRDGATVDVLYVLGRILAFEDEMLERSIVVDIDGVDVRLIGREDLAVGQAGAAKPEVPIHWFQAVDLLRADDVDWPYVVRRAAVAPDLRFALLRYLRHAGGNVPEEILREIERP